MSQEVGKNHNKVYRLVLTGGPCGGKTTGQARLCNFFENLGWKVYRVPETAAMLLGGGIKFADLDEESAFKFQENLIKTMIQTQDTFFDLASNCCKNCLVICDRGIKDGASYLSPAQWDRMKELNDWNDVELRDSRYNQVIHMVTAANGAEPFYKHNKVRGENIELARKLDDSAIQAWTGHPYYDIIDNSTDFDKKVNRMIYAVCSRLGIDVADRLHRSSRKRKFLLNSVPQNIGQQVQEFIVVHNYLATPGSNKQARIRKRGQDVKWDSDKNEWDLDSGHWSYTHTERGQEINGESPEVKMQISAKEYKLLLAQRDTSRYKVLKKRQLFICDNLYYQIDIYLEPCHPRCHGLVLLEIYTTLEGDNLRLPSFLDVQKEVTNIPAYSMYNLCKKDASIKLSSSNDLQNSTIEPEKMIH